MLHLTGTSITLEEIKSFRQWGSPAAGHPEYGEAAGIETTTGPLGQGFANGVGMALAERWLRTKFGADLSDHFTFVFCGDGCLMEGISNEAGSLAGHLGLGRLIVMYDDNQITIDGATDLSFTEDVPARFAALGWQVISADGHDHQAISSAIEQAKGDGDRPTLIAFRTVIAHGAPNLAGSNKSHGAPLGHAEIAATKLLLGMDPDATFAVPAEVVAHFRKGDGGRSARRAAWESRLGEHPQADQWRRFHADPDLSRVQWPDFGADTGKLATRKSSEQVLQALGAQLGNLIGGSADLAGSNGSVLKGEGELSAADFDGRNIHFGVREHAMAAVSNGMSLHGGLLPYCATFLAFHDYMRPSVRLAALMNLPVMFIYTHDSVFLGEDGPTHQPVEHVMAMRTIPNLWVIRPGDAAETAEAWRMAIERRDGPVALCLTRQGLPTLDRDNGLHAPSAGSRKGAYVLRTPQGDPDIILIATGSEVALALDAADALHADGVAVRVVSMPCWEVFETQDAAYRASVLPADVPKVSVEAGITFGWRTHVGMDGGSVGIDRFGASAPGAVAADRLGLNLEAVVAAVRSTLGR
jgi:transketolase